jgi:hypothetical protein
MCLDFTGLVAYVRSDKSENERATSRTISVISYQRSFGISHPKLSADLRTCMCVCVSERARACVHKCNCDTLSKVSVSYNEIRYAKKFEAG